MSPVTAGLSELSTATLSLRARVLERLDGRDLDTQQVAANELAWATAHREAASATVEWAAATDDGLARDVAAAAVQDASGFVTGASALDRIGSAELLASIALRSNRLADLGATDEQRLLRSTFRDFATTYVRPVAGDIHRGDLDIPDALIKDLANLGAFALGVPEQYGGLQAAEDDFDAMLIVTEELSRASLAVGSLSTRPEILVRALLRGGTEAQRQRWLPDIASGERLVAVAATEPDYGSDVANMRCAATRVDGGWTVSGTKLWCTFAGRAELLMVLLRTGDGGHRGLSAFVVEKPGFAGHTFSFEQPGGGRLQGRAIPTVGYRGMHTFELSFENFFVDDDALIGGEGWLDRGFYLQMEGFSSGRLQTAARAVGVMQAALDDTLTYTAQRIVFGRPIVEFGLPRATLGQMAVRLQASRQLTRMAARRMNADDGGVQAALAKLYASRMAESVARDAVQLHGGMGYAEETDVSRYFVDSRVLSIFEGAEEVLALRVIARSLLGAR
jgi:(2S)-methylsuccinyl-CoA dehydrogenase